MSLEIVSQKNYKISVLSARLKKSDREVPILRTFGELPRKYFFINTVCSWGGCFYHQDSHSDMRKNKLYNFSKIHINLRAKYFKIY